MRRRRSKPNLYLHGTDILGAISRYGTTTTLAPTVAPTTTTAVRVATTTPVAPTPAPVIQPIMTTLAPQTAPVTSALPMVTTTMATAPVIRPVVTTLAQPTAPVTSALQQMAATMATAPASAATRAAATMATAPVSALSREAALMRPTFSTAAKAGAATMSPAVDAAKKRADEQKAAAKARSSAAKSAAANRAIAAGQRLARHKRGRAGSKLVSLGRKAAKKATQVQGVLDTVLGLFETSAAKITTIVQTEMNWEAAVNGLAQAADIAAMIYPLADKLQVVDPPLAQEGYSIGDQAQAIIDQYGGDALFDTPDLGSVSASVRQIQSAASSWQGRAQAALAATAPSASAAQTDQMSPGDAGAGGGGDSGGGSSGGGGGGGGGGGDEGAAEAEMAAAEMAAEAGSGGGGGGGGSEDGVDWGPENERDSLDEGRGGEAAPSGGGGYAEAAVETAEEQPAGDRLAVGDRVTSSEKADLGEGTVQLVVDGSVDVQWDNDGSTTSEPLSSLQRVGAKEDQEVMGNIYLHGVDILGDMGSGGAPSAAMDYGPSLGPGTVYTDPSTILAAQKSLLERGINPGPVDGVFGPKTEAALFKLSGKHGPPDDATLALLGIKPGGASTGGGMGVIVTPIKEWLAKTFGAQPGTAPVKPGAAASTALVPAGHAVPGWWKTPAWRGSPVSRWQAATAVGGATAILAGLVIAVRK